MSAWNEDHRILHCIFVSPQTLPFFTISDNNHTYGWGGGVSHTDNSIKSIKSSQVNRRYTDYMYTR